MISKYECIAAVICARCPCFTACEDSRIEQMVDIVKGLFPSPCVIPKPGEMKFIVNVEPDECFVRVHVWRGRELSPYAYERSGGLS